MRSGGMPGGSWTLGRGFSACAGQSDGVGGGIHSGTQHRDVCPPGNIPQATAGGLLRRSEAPLGPVYDQASGTANTGTDGTRAYCHVYSAAADNKIRFFAHEKHRGVVTEMDARKEFRVSDAHYCSEYIANTFLLINIIEINVLSYRIAGGNGGAIDCG
jgi:hypothetical protein